MLKSSIAQLFLLTPMAAGLCGSAQTPTVNSVVVPAWEDVASWDSVRPIQTHNIVYANVAQPGNRSANPASGTSVTSGTSGSTVPAAENSATAAPGTMKPRLDVLQMPSSKRLSLYFNSMAAGGFEATVPTASTPSAPSWLAE